jgi:hypothetical protein
MPGNPLLKGKTNGANNSEGRNGADNGTCRIDQPTLACHFVDVLSCIGPKEDVLGESLHKYARLGDSLAVRQRKLREDHDLKIGCVKLLSSFLHSFSNNIVSGTVLKQLNTYFKVGSVRKPIPREAADQQILNEMADDAHKYRGPNTVKRNLALADVHISR